MKSTARGAGAVPFAGHRGFTLIELMTVIVIIAILTLIAIPGYQAEMRKTRRTDAKVALSELANREEKFFSNATPPHFTATITTAWPNGLAYTSVSPDGYYQLTVTATAGGFTATAKPISSGPQASDTDCQTMSIDETGNKSSSPRSDCW